MKGRWVSVPRFCSSAAILLMAVLIAASAVPAGAAPRETVAGLSRDEALRLGERMYREGVLPSGKPLQGIVKTDIPMDGSKFTCAHCHQRSGFGSMEGTIRTWPIHGAQLYSPLSQFKRIPIRSRRQAVLDEGSLRRPAYTDQTLARVLRTGVDPAGRQLDDIMPIYDLSERDMGLLVYYLKNLSTGNEPGVTDAEVRLATVVAGPVSDADRELMLGQLRLFLKNWKMSRAMERMTRADAYVSEGVVQEPRNFTLAVWELKGQADTWNSQLESFYRKEPVFALLAGMSAGDWKPIHRFCEEHRIPSVFPVTDYPVIPAADGYTLYLSKGLYGEGEAAARFLEGRSVPKDAVVVQVVRDGLAGETLARAFQESWTGSGHATPVNIKIGAGEQASAFWAGQSGWNANTIFVLWLAAPDIPDPERLPTPNTIIASGTLLGSALNSVPEKLRPSLYIAYPYTVEEKTAGSVQQSVYRDPVPGVGQRLSPLFTILRGPFARMRSSVYRDYFMELLEATPDLTAGLAAYPRMSFGTGQRYASKGCYMVQLTPGPNPELVKRTDWIIP